MKVYEDTKGTQIKFRPKNNWAKGTEFMVLEREDRIELIKLGVLKNESRN